LKADWDKRRQTDGKAFASLLAKPLVESQMILWQLGYGAKFTGALDAQTQQALRNFQAAKGIAVSGGLDALTYYALTEDQFAVNKHLVSAVPYLFNWRDTYVSVTGAWNGQNTSDGYVVSSELTCRRSENTCTEKQAVLSGETLMPSGAEYQITKWDNYEIIAEDAVPLCARNELRINQQEKSVLLVSCPTYKTESCNQFTGKPEMVTYKMVAGSEIYIAQSEARSKRNLSLYQLSPASRVILEAKLP
jgi:hypothetical protein